MRPPGFFRHSKGNGGDFWRWFLRNETSLRSIRTGAEPIAVELTEKLRAEHEGLQWEMSVSDAEERTFFISAGGVPDVIPAVEAMLAKSPPIPGWRIVAFRQRKTKDSVQVGGRQFGIGDVWFSAEPHREHVNLKLFMKGFDKRDEAAYHAFFLLLDVVLGEYDVMTKVGNIDFYPLPPDPQAEGLRPLTELAEIVDRL